jgi:dTDP-4-amino-4,6-dideoxygalactose transaminase
LNEIELRIVHDMKDISTFSSDLQVIESKVPAVEESVDRAWQIMKTKSKLEICSYQCATLMRQLRAIRSSMDSREEKVSRYRNWLKGMQVRIDLMTLAGRKAEMWKSRWKWISRKLHVAIASLRSHFMPGCADYLSASCNGDPCHMLCLDTEFM